ncbi:hypothetical protein FOZ60_004115 [Perkinsus olseni]|uniref:Uncharacterized protein n=1 Tax=Perkinsus olseni TaxID=32597 RepID=A0A7J6PHF8_PEROL|nr:hypothetical protein FOZ60_004115 [Perkinsus olseni]
MQSDQWYPLARDAASHAQVAAYVCVRAAGGIANRTALAIHKFRLANCDEREGGRGLMDHAGHRLGIERTFGGKFL